MLTMGTCKKCGYNKIIRILDNKCQLRKAMEIYVMTYEL